MPRIAIVSGAPGTGKTTLARRLAGAAPRGLHLVSDLFYGFVAQPIDPTRPESHAQNESVIRAVGGAASSFAADGYAVVIDGVIGPWFLPVLVAALPEPCAIDYAVLRAPLAEAQARVRSREGAGESARVAHMHRAFAELGPLASHALETGGRSPEAVFASFLEARAAGAFQLERARALALPPLGGAWRPDR